MPEASNPWPEIDAWLARNAPRVLRALRAPANDAALARVGRALGRALPVAIADAYRAHDGVRDEQNAWLGAVRVPDDARWVRYMWLLSANEALARWHFMRDLGISWAEALLPIAADAGGNVVVVNLDDGRCGAWDHETAEVIQLASDFGAWMGALAEDMSTGLVVAGSEDDDEEATLTLLAAPAPARARRPVVAPDRPARVLLELLLERRFIALAAGANVEPLVAHLTNALSKRTAKSRASAVMSLLEESDAVEEIFAEDDWIEVLVSELG
jgi:cell wall assembly regulator SMI1